MTYKACKIFTGLLTAPCALIARSTEPLPKHLLNPASWLECLCLSMMTKHRGSEAHRGLREWMWVFSHHIGSAYLKWHFVIASICEMYFSPCWIKAALS